MMTNRTLYTLIVLASIAMALFLGNGTSFDLLNYHYWGAWALLHGESFSHILPAQHGTFVNPTIYLIYYTLAIATKPWFTTVVMAALHSVAIIGVIKIADLVGDMKFVEKAGIAILVLMSSAYTYQVGTSYGDILLAIPCIFALYFLLRRDFVWSGILFGLAAGFKLTMMIYLPAFIVLILVYRRPIWLLYAALGFLVSGGIWHGILLAKYHNPVFPFMNGIFYSPFAVSSNWIDTRFGSGVIGHLTRIFDNMKNHISSPTEVMSILIVTGTGWYAARTKNILPENLWVLFVFILGSFLVWSLVFGIYRYYIVAALLSPLAVVIATRKPVWFPLVLILYGFSTHVETADRIRIAQDPLSVDLPYIATGDSTVVVVMNDRPQGPALVKLAKEAKIVRLNTSFNRHFDNGFWAGAARNTIVDAKSVWLLSNTADVNEDFMKLGRFFNFAVNNIAIPDGATGYVSMDVTNLIKKSFRR